MSTANYLLSKNAQELAPAEAQVILLVTGDNSLVRRFLPLLSGKRELLRIDESRPYQLPIATSVAQARSSVLRAAPSAILLDELVAGAGLTAGDLQDFSRHAPVVLLASMENFPRWCANREVAKLIQQGRLEYVPRTGDFLTLAAQLIERHTRARPAPSVPDNRQPGAVGWPVRVQLDPHEAPREFGEVLRHELNNPLTGILGNAELILAHRERLPATAVERIEVVAELAIRLRETVRRLSNALDPLVAQPWPGPRRADTLPRL